MRRPEVEGSGGERKGSEEGKWREGKRREDGKGREKRTWGHQNVIVPLHPGACSPLTPTNTHETNTSRHTCLQVV